MDMKATANFFWKGEDGTNALIRKGEIIDCDKESRKQMLKDGVAEDIKLCKICGNEIPLAEVFNSNPLSIASYFTLIEYRGRRHWCLKCTMKKMESSYKKQKVKP